MIFIRVLVKVVILLLAVFAGGALTCSASDVNPDSYGSPKGEVCITCHRETSPGIYSQWKASGHGQAGVNCYDCHRAQEGDPDAFEHKGLISVLVTPKDCSKCHEAEFRVFSASRHADAVAVLDTDDNFFGRVGWGDADDRTGCIPCHGSTVVIQKDGLLAPATWPNSGIGRINPDNSKGSCAACHTRHLFSKEQARRPESCGRCHTGANQPQIEVYTRSNHGIMFAAFSNRMNMENRLWLAGQDYFQAPTCATCHMSAIPPQMEVKTADERIREALEGVLAKDRELLTALMPPTPTIKVDYGATHDVSTRLSWKLSPEGSTKRENWQKKRQEMQSVCMQCHGEHFINQHYAQFDRIVAAYNEKFALPATRIRSDLIRNGDITKQNFDEKIDLIYWKLWNDGGHAALDGAAMVSPSHLWTNGMQKVAEHYQMDFIPAVRDLHGRGSDRFLRKHGYTPPRYGLWSK